MTIKIGDAMPAGTFGEMTENGPSTVTTDELFAGKKVVLFAVPGAFTPTCSAQHVPGFLANVDAIDAKGIDAIACMSVNDVFVMAAWGRELGVGDNIRMLADGNGDYAIALGLDADSRPFNMGIRSRRFAMVVDDGIVKSIAVDEPGQFEITSAESVLAQL
jgi:peroxiredoxin